MRDQLILDNLNLIYFVIKQMGLYQEREYYYDIGLIGLIQAADKYEQDKGSVFSTYAVYSIRNAILLDIRSNNTNKRKANQGIISLDTVIMSDNTDVTLADVIPDGFNLEQYIIEKERMALAKQAISSLTADEQKILRLYYFKNINQKDIAKITNSTQVNVCRKLKKIIKKLQEIVKYKKGK